MAATSGAVRPQQTRQPRAHRVGAPSEPYVDLLKPRGRLEHERRGAVSSIFCEGDLTEKRVELCTLEVIERAPGRAASPDADSKAPASRFDWAARSERPARRAGSTVNATDRSKNAAAAGKPPLAARSCRGFQFGGYILVWAGRRLGSVPRPPVRVEGPSVASANVLWVSRLSFGAAML